MIRLRALSPTRDKYSSLPLLVGYPATASQNEPGALKGPSTRVPVCSSEPAHEPHKGTRKSVLIHFVSEGAPPSTKSPSRCRSVLILICLPCAFGPIKTQGEAPSMPKQIMRRIRRWAFNFIFCYANHPLRQLVSLFVPRARILGDSFPVVPNSRNHGLFPAFSGADFVD